MTRREWILALSGAAFGITYGGIASQHGFWLLLGGLTLVATLAVFLVRLEEAKEEPQRQRRKMSSNRLSSLYRVPHPGPRQSQSSQALKPSSASTNGIAGRR